MPVTALPPVPPKPAAPPPPQPQILMGLDEAAVAKLIGKPVFKRADDPAAIWRYHAGDCVLDLYLHNDGPAPRVVHYEFRPGEGATVVDPAGCMARLSTRGAEREGRP